MKKESSKIIFLIAHSRKVFALCVFLCCFCSQIVIGQSNDAYQWNTVVMGGGGFVSGIITNKTAKDLIYARTDVGGAYRWDASASKWIPLLDWVSENEVGYLGVESLATDQQEPNKVYMLVGTSYFNKGKTAILRSDNYGKTFSVVDVTAQFKAHGNGMGRQTGEKLVIDPNNNTILFCGSRANGLFKSINSGISWNHVDGLGVTTTTSGNGISFIVFDPSTGNPGSATQTLIAGISQTENNLYRSDDSGKNFSRIENAPSTLMPHRAVLAKDRNLYITYTNAAGPWDIRGAGQIWKYNLSSGSWTNVTPLSFTGAFGGITVDPNDVNRLAASSLNTYQRQENNSYGDRIFLSTDGGLTWTDVVARGFQMDSNGAPWIRGESIHWAGAIEFDPNDTKEVWIISGNGIFKTDNIDSTQNVWKFTVQGIEESVPLDLICIPNGPLLSAIADYDGFRHTDVSHSSYIHKPKMGSTSGIAYAEQNPNIVLRAGNKLYYSTDMGVTWSLCVSMGKQGKVAVSCDGNVFLHSPQESNTTYRSTDKGSSWTSVTGIDIKDARVVADPVNPLKFYAYNYSNGTLLISIDGGISFSEAGHPGRAGSKVIRLVPDRTGDLWIPMYGDGLTHSTNAGLTFSKIKGINFCEAVGFGKQAPGKSYPTLYAWAMVHGVLGIHRSTDEGKTWQHLNDAAHQYGGPANGQFVMGDMNIFGRVYMSTAGRGIIYGEPMK